MLVQHSSLELYFSPIPLLEFLLQQLQWPTQTFTESSSSRATATAFPTRRIHTPTILHGPRPHRSARSAYFHSSPPLLSTNTPFRSQVQSHALGRALRAKYFSSSSPSYILNVHTDLVDPDEIQARYTAGGEAGAVFDSATATLQGLFPPNEKNSIVMSDGRRVVAPLGGYQYVHLETVEPAVDRALEGWTNCPVGLFLISGLSVA